MFWCYWENFRGSGKNRQREDAAVSSSEEGGKETVKGETMAYRRITQEEAREKMNTEEGLVILDVRTREEYESGHIRGAVCLPNEEITEEPEELPDKSQTILVYCRSGNRSRQAAEKLAAFGYENVCEFGGILDWPYAEMLE